MTTPNNERADLRYSQIPWTEKHRPYKLEDVVMPKSIKNKLLEITSTKEMQNIILAGPSGIGKSCAIKAVALSLYGRYYNDAVLELNLLDDRGIKFMQADILLFCRSKIPYKNGDEKFYPAYKLIIFDEADNVIGRVQDQISNIMEKYPKNIRFAFTCNLSSEINEAIQTKCLVQRYTYLSSDMVVEKLTNICKKENVAFTENSLKKIAELSRGDVRNAINKLQMLYNKYDEITEENVNDLCDLPQEVTIRKLFAHVMDKNLHDALKIALDFKKNSYSGSDITAGMLTIMRSDICKDIPENIKIKLCKSICDGRFRISNITDSDLQLAGCIVDMVRAIA